MKKKYYDIIASQWWFWLLLGVYIGILINGAAYNDLVTQCNEMLLQQSNNSIRFIR